MNTGETKQHEGNTKTATMEELFGGTTQSKHRDVTQTKRFHDALTEDLNLDHGTLLQLNEKDPEVVRDFLIDVCKNIQWYTAELNTKLKARRIYFGANVALIILVPVAVYLLPLVQFLFGAAQQSSAQLSSDIAVTVAQLTAALTGLFGLQRAFLEWQKQSNRYVQLWEASANLKTEYYMLRTKWHDKVKPDKVQELLSDMKNATASARAIVRKEQDDFYKSLSAAAPVDALNVLKEVQGVVSQFISGGKPPEVFVKQLEAVEKEQKDTYKVLTDQRRMVARIEAELGAVQNRIQKRQDELNMVPQSGADDRKTELKNALAKLRDERDRKEAELASAKGALAALTTS